MTCLLELSLTESQDKRKFREKTSLVKNITRGAHAQVNVQHTSHLHANHCCTICRSSRIFSNAINRYNKGEDPHTTIVGPQNANRDSGANESGLGSACNAPLTAQFLVHEFLELWWLNLRHGQVHKEYRHGNRSMFVKLDCQKLLRINSTAPIPKNNKNYLHLPLIDFWT